MSATVPMLVRTGDLPPTTRHRLEAVMLDAIDVWYIARETLHWYQRPFARAILTPAVEVVQDGRRRCLP